MIWSGEGEDRDGDWRVELANVELGEAGLRAHGTQLGAVPVPYRLEYRLDATGEGFATRSLYLEATGAGWVPRLRLERDPEGEWMVDGAVEPALAGALDCDLGLSPLTNAMPVHRHRLDREPGSAEFVMAWVSVPDLAVHAARQRYRT